MFDIRAIRISDVDACARIVRDNWGRDVGDKFLVEVAHVWAMDMENPPAYYVADSERGEVIGFAGMMSSFLMHGIWDLIWINVKKEYQREGVGKRLTEYRVTEIKRCNGSAIHLMTQSPLFFEKLGFEIIHHYEGWKLMSMRLGPLKL